MGVAARDARDRLVVILVALSATLGGCSPHRGPTLSLSTEERQSLKDSWQLYLNGDPSWPVARAEWIAKGEAARSLLIENLLGDLVLGLDRGARPRIERAGAELAGIGMPALPHLIEAIRVGDDVVGKECARVIARIGPSAVEPLIAAMPGAPVRVRLRGFEALGELGDARAGPTLEKALEAESDWRVRAAAAAALGRTGGMGAGESLLAALKDPDPFVRSQVAEALGALGEKRAIDPLIGLLESSAATGDPAQACVVRECGGALRLLTGQTLSDNPRAWREWRAERTLGRSR